MVCNSQIPSPFYSNLFSTLILSLHFFSDSPYILTYPLTHSHFPFSYPISLFTSPHTLFCSSHTFTPSTNLDGNSSLPLLFTLPFYSHSLSWAYILTLLSALIFILHFFPEVLSGIYITQYLSYTNFYHSLHSFPCSTH